MAILSSSRAHHALAFIGLLLLAACAAPGPPERPAPAGAPPAPEEAAPPLEAPALAATGGVRIGLLLPLSGPEREVGQALLNAAEMALFDIGDPNIELLPRDTRGTAEGAADAARAALADGARLLLGPLLAPAVRAAGEVARDHGVKVIGFSTDRTVAGSGVYLMGFMPEQQVRRIVDYAVGAGHERFAALVPESAYGDLVLRAFAGDLFRANAALVAIEFFPTDATKLAGAVRRLADYDARRQALLDERASLEALGEDDSLATELLEELKPRETLGDLDFDAVFVPAGGALLRALAPLLPYYEIDPDTIKFLGTGLWDDLELAREPALNGAWFAAPPPEAAQAFMARYTDIFGEPPPRLASLGYDAMALAATLVRSGGPQPFSEAAITNPNGFAGIDGIFRFRADGIAERGLAVLEIRTRKFAVIAPAPKSFQPLAN